MKRIALMALLLTACDPVGNSSGGVIELSHMSNSAFRKADAHCQKYGKEARMTMRADNAVAFACVSP